MMKKPAAVLALSLAALVAAPAGAAEIGDELPAYALKDANGKAYTLGPEVRRIYASADRAGDNLLKAALEKDGQARLDAQQAVVIADISDVPFFIKGMVRSSVEERPYATWLDEDKTTRKHIPYREDRVTVLDLEQRRISAIRFVADLGDLNRELQPPAPPAPEAPAPPEANPATESGQDPGHPDPGHPDPIEPDAPTAPPAP